MNNRTRCFGIVLAAATCLIVLSGCAAGERTVVVSDAEAAPTITVTANSEVKVVPDKAQIGVAVTTQAKSAAETQDQNTTKVNAVVDALKALGVDEKSIQTSYSNLNPRYDYSNPLNYGAIVPDGSTEEIPDAFAETNDFEEPNDATNIVGYEMTTRLIVKDLDINRVGEVLSACVAAGANNTDGVQYYSSEYDAKYAEALAAAVDAARAKAEVLAKASGAQLGAVYSVTEGYQNTAFRYDTGMALEAASNDSTMKVMPGEINIEANVTVAYEIA